VKGSQVDDKRAAGVWLDRKFADGWIHTLWKISTAKKKAPGG